MDITSFLLYTTKGKTLASENAISQDMFKLNLFIGERFCARTFSEKLLVMKSGEWLCHGMAGMTDEKKLDEKNVSGAL